MNETRTDKSIRNVKFALVAQCLNLLAGFAARRAFVLFLSAEYLGLGGLFSSVLNMLSLAELGVGAAITFSLYKPLAQGDEGRLASLMALYRRAYIAIGLTVLLLGAALMPFLPSIIKDIPDIPHIRLIYLLFILNAALGYFFGYKQALLLADQKRYILNLYTCAFSLLQYLLQIATLYLTRSYIAYLLIYVACPLLSNLLLAHKANGHYPFLRGPKPQPLLPEDKATILGNVKAMVAHKIGTVVVLGTDNLLIARMVGLAATGLYSNYLLITSALNVVYGSLYQAVVASVGNLGTQEDRELLHLVFARLNFFGAWLYAFSAACLLALLNPTITLWLGPAYCFPMSTVFLVTLNFYLVGMRQAVLTFRDALGLYRPDRYKPLFESAINLGASIWLGMRLGVDGVLLGTAISTIATCFWVEPYMLYKHGFGKSCAPFFRQYAVYAAAAAGACLLTLAVSAYIPGQGLASLALRFAVCAALPNAFLLLCFFRRDEFRFFLDLLARRLPWKK